MCCGGLLTGSSEGEGCRSSAVIGRFGEDDCSRGSVTAIGRSVDGYFGLTSTGKEVSCSGGSVIDDIM